MSQNNEVILDHVCRRIYRNANAFIIVVGDVGSGKSYFALDLALKISERFDTPFNKDWVQFSSEGMYKAAMRDHKRGQVILLDEMGVIMSNRRAMAKGNVGLSFLLQTIRSQNHILIFTVPDFSFVDKVARTLIHYRAIVKPRFRNNQNFVTFQIMKISQYKGVSYPAPVYYKLKDGTIKTASTFTSDIPPEWLRLEYEEKKKEFQVGLWDRIKDMNLNS